MRDEGSGASDTRIPWQRAAMEEVDHSSWSLQIRYFPITPVSGALQKARTRSGDGAATPPVRGRAKDPILIRGSGPDAGLIRGSGPDAGSHGDHCVNRLPYERP